MIEQPAESFAGDLNSVQGRVIDVFFEFLFGFGIGILIGNFRRVAFAPDHVFQETGFDFTRSLSSDRLLGGSFLFSSLREEVRPSFSFLCLFNFVEVTN